MAIWNFLIIFTVKTNKPIRAIVVCIAISFTQKQRNIMYTWRSSIIHNVTPFTFCIAFIVRVKRVHCSSGRSSRATPVWFLIRTKTSIVRHLLDSSFPICLYVGVRASAPCHVIRQQIYTTASIVRGSARTPVDSALWLG